MTSSDPVVEAPERFEDFFYREYRNMVVLAVAVSGSRALGEDLAQEAMLRAHRHWDKISEYDQPGAWLRRVTINLASTARTRLRREVRAVLRLGSDQPRVEPVSGRDGQVWEAVRRLPAGQRAAVALYYLEDRSVADVAEILGVTLNTAKAHLYKGRQTLASRLAAYDPRAGQTSEGTS